jgi:hypothetical protein
MEIDIKKDENISIIIKKWLDKKIQNLDTNDVSMKKRINIIDLSTFDIIELLNIVNLYLYKNNNNINTNITTIINGNKTIIQVNNPILLSLFHKKQLNSNWTYLQYANFNDFNDFNEQFRCNLDIHLHQSKSKSYTVSSKKKKPTSKTNSKKGKQESKQLNFNQFFDSESE